MAAADHLKTFGVVDVTDSFCWNSPFGSRKPAGQQCALNSVVQPSFDQS